MEVGEITFAFRFLVFKQSYITYTLLEARTFSYTIVKFPRMSIEPS